jgi:hypothetical protein
MNRGASDLHQIYRSQIRRALHQIHRSGSRRSQICRSGRLHRIRSARAAAGLRGSTAASPSTGSASPVPPPARSTGSAEVEVALRRRSSGQARTGPLLRERGGRRPLQWDEGRGALSQWEEGRWAPSRWRKGRGGIGGGREGALGGRKGCRGRKDGRGRRCGGSWKGEVRVDYGFLIRLYTLTC